MRHGHMDECYPTWGYTTTFFSSFNIAKYPIFSFDPNHQFQVKMLSFFPKIYLQQTQAQGDFGKPSFL